MTLKAAAIAPAAALADGANAEPLLEAEKVEMIFLKADGEMVLAAFGLPTL